MKFMIAWKIQPGCYKAAVEFQVRGDSTWNTTLAAGHAGFVGPKAIKQSFIALNVLGDGFLKIH
jgi:hypothetical protein